MSIFRKNLSSADRKAIDDYIAIVRSLDAKDAELAEANKRYAYEGHAKMVVLEQLSEAKAEIDRLTAENKALTEEVRQHRIALDWLSILIKKG